MNTYFTSDIHFGHTNILKYDNRQFNTIEDHDETIIQNWNSIINKDDFVYYLGDFALCNSKKAESIMSRLNGNKYFIKGNHDKDDTIKLYKKYGTYLGELKKVKVEDQEIILCHYCLKVWDKSHKGSWHLWGHSHGSLPEDIYSKSFDVGIMLWNYYPVSFEQVYEKMQTKIWKPIDHHI